MIAGGRRQWLLRPVPSPCQGPQGTQAESEEEQAVGLRHRHRVVHAGARIVREGRKDRLGVIARNNMIVGIEVEAGDIADDRQLIDVDLPGADKEIGREGVDEVANRRIRESEVAEAELLPFRSEERRVGKAWVDTYRSRWSPEH